MLEEVLVLYQQIIHTTKPILDQEGQVSPQSTKYITIDMFGSAYNASMNRSLNQRQPDSYNVTNLSVHHSPIQPYPAANQNLPNQDYNPSHNFKSQSDFTGKVLFKVILFFYRFQSKSRSC